MFEVDDPSDFNAIQLQTLDEHLRCPICKEFFDTAMILSTCSHSFCALCIRRSLTAEQICPKCRKTSYENNLHNNYDLDNVVQTWKQTRSILINLEKIEKEKNEKGKNKAEEPQQSYTLPPRLKTRSKKEDSDFVSPSSSSSLQQQQQQQQQPSSSSAAASSSSSTRTTRRSLRVGTVSSTIESEKKAQEEPLKSTSIVTCPICEQEMKYSVLDIHLDRCMKGDSSIPEEPSISTNEISSKMEKMRIPSILKSTNPGKKPTKVVYALKNEKQMRDILKELGLPDHGDKALKIWRHKEYINIYEANADSNNPVGHNALLQRLATSENFYLNSKQNQAKRKTTDLDVHKQKYSDEFSRLIEDTKRRRTMGNPQ